MSVINQMLNQLEQRGVQTAGQAMVRAVPRTRRKYTWPLLAAAVLAVIAAWQWASANKTIAASHASSAGNAPVAPLPNGAITPSQPVVAGAVASSGAVASGVAVEARLVEKDRPAIGGVNPDPVIANGARSPLTINGRNFTKDSSVTLYSPDGKVYLKRPASSRSETKITINPNFGTEPGVWKIEVSTAHGTSSGQFAFTVQAPVIAGKQDAGRSLASIAAARQAPEKELATEDGLSLPIKHVSAAQQADAEFRKAAALMQKGRVADAMAGYELALRLDAGHDVARQALVALLLENNRRADAERVLLERPADLPEHPGFTMILARILVERGAIAEAIETMEKVLPHADTLADYQAFLAALLQREDRHDEAVAHYQAALQIDPNNGLWLMGYGISLQAIQRNAEAKQAFRRALDTQMLNQDLREFVQARIKGL